MHSVDLLDRLDDVIAAEAAGSRVGSDVARGLEGPEVASPMDTSFEFLGSGVAGSEPPLACLGWV